MSRIPVRLILAILAAAISVTLLVWSLWPSAHLIRYQFLQPTQMQLPTQGSYEPFYKFA